MKFNFDFTLTNLDGASLTDEQGIELNAARTAANLIMKIPEGGPDIMVKYDWATQLHKTGTIDLDKSGQLQFQKVLESIPNVWLSVRGQLLEVIKKRKDELAAE